jgi:FkbM family methyltransferase
MNNSSKMLIKRIFRKMGLELHGFNPSSSPNAQIVYSLNNFKIDLIFDVGANSGQFASEIRQGGFRGRIVSFEPLTDAYKVLSAASCKDVNWDVHPRCAIGDCDGEAIINIAGNSASSSILPMLESHSNAAPNTAYIGKEVVQLCRLDTIAPKYFKIFGRPFLKIDTQGFEWKVLDGCINSLPYMKGILLEMSLIPLYEGQHLWEDMLLRMKEAGFTLWALQPGFTDQKNGRTYQVDGIFFRTASNDDQQLNG